ncbi:MAG: VCBS repeat-containing protein [Deltaproteobacteria bacterium]|nr:MAG: VCBS repeat-containing protein [Deltaproteobacteria bacterium]
MRVRLLLPALALLGCKPEETAEVQPISTVMEFDEAVGLEIAPATGNVPLTTVARVTNALGASVLGGPEEVVINGTTESVSVDGLGYGEITVDAAGSVEVLGGDEPVTLHALDSTWPGFGAQGGELPLGEAVFAQTVSEGVAVASASEVWWVGPGLPAHRVLAFPAGKVISGIRSGHADSDGRLDLLVWGGDTAIVLRGRPGGGLAWATGFQAEGNAVVGGAFGDVNQDDAQDIVLAWAVAGGSSSLEVLEGDGAGNYVGVPVSLADQASDVAIGDNDGDGREEITAISGVDWERFGWSDSDQAYEIVGPSNLQGLNFPAGTRVWSGRDYNGDGADELVMIGALQNGQDREVLVYDLVGQANVTFLSLSPFGAEIALGDATGDGQGEVFMLEESGELKHVVWHQNNGSRLNTADVGERGPLAISNGTSHADLADVLIAGDTWTWWHGTLYTGEDGESWWTDGEPEVTAFAANADGFARIEADGNASTVEFVTVGRSGGATAAQVYQVTPGTPPTVAPLGAAIQLANPARNVMDVAACSGVIYALLDGELYRAAVGGNVTSTAATGTAVACGMGPSGATAATLAGDTITLWNDTLTSVGTQTSTGAENLALGVGSEDLQVCTSTGCGVVYWPDGNGGGEWAISTNSGITVGATELHGGGELAVEDVDGDGHLDLLASWENGRLGVYRSTGEGFSTGEFFHMARQLAGPPIAFDATGEGDVDLAVFDDGGALYITPTPGTPPAVNSGAR